MVFFICYQSYAEQFIYPVASLQEKNQLLVLYQKSLQDIELWIWDTIEHTATKGLSSFTIPANLRILPSGDGFSFIDNGYIKIKEFAKRSPKTLPIYEPIGLFFHMNWIDEHRFYFVAREGDFFQIFQGDAQANIYRLTYDAADALYPQKINSDLFYIKRDEDGQVSIVHQSWNPASMHDKSVIGHQEIFKSEDLQQLCFLKMMNEHEGFFIQAPTKKIDHDQLYLFSCYHLLQADDTWSAEKIFDFKIPAKYVTGSQRLYESIEPFLPNYTNHNIVYFMSWQEETEQGNLYEFCKIKKTVRLTELSFGRHNQKIFVPYFYNHTMYCGLIMQDDQLFFDEKYTHFDLPSLPQKQNC